MSPALELASLSRQIPVSSERKRFTIDGAPTLEQFLADLCAGAREVIQAAIPVSRLQAVLLGGGYGRGEGGVLRTSSGERAYNDLEFYVFLHGPGLFIERKFQPTLHACGERLSARAGLDVEFRAITLQKLRRSRGSMFYYDLIMGHRWILGDPGLLSGCDHLRSAELIPLHDATRLLMNRCSGLLFAKERLLRPNFQQEDADFVGRNIAKAELALGDVILTVHGQYHWSCLERNQRVHALTDELDFLNEVQRAHDRGPEFKLHPTQKPVARQPLLDALLRASELARQVWLWLESRRLGEQFRTISEYSLWTGNRSPEVPSSRAFVINLRERNFRRKLWRYPRDRVLMALPLLLWCWESADSRRLHKAVQQELNCDSNDFSALVGCYRQLWSTVN